MPTVTPATPRQQRLKPPTHTDHQRSVLTGALKIGLAVVVAIAFIETLLHVRASFAGLPEPKWQFSQGAGARLALGHPWGAEASSGEVRRAATADDSHLSCPTANV